MTGQDKPLALSAADVPARSKPSVYPEPFSGRMARRVKHPLGDLFGLGNFGVNLTVLKPGGESALMHRHSLQDEFVYVVSGEVTLVTDRGEMVMTAGMCAGFPKGGVAHHLVNRSPADVTYLEIGDRTAGDSAEYPNDDIRADMDASGKWVFSHKDGRPY